jgi:putative chitinase
MMFLHIGSRGDEVKKIQEKLGLKADGIFGARTEKAVKTWQAAHGLTADGIVGAATWGTMFTDAPAGEQELAGGALQVEVAGVQLDNLVGHVPEVVLSQMSECIEKFQINSVLRLAHFLAQCAHESGGFKVKEENLNYSARGLKGTFPKYFPGNLAESYAWQPEKIASRVYGGRMGNGDEASKEGYIFRGRGYMQLTGKDNYRAFAQTVEDNIMNDPDLVASKYPLLSAAWFWHIRALNASADKGASDAVVTEVTKKVNGGTLGLEERIKHFKVFYGLLART